MFVQGVETQQWSLYSFQVKLANKPLPPMPSVQCGLIVLSISQSKAGRVDGRRGLLAYWPMMYLPGDASILLINLARVRLARGTFGKREGKRLRVKDMRSLKV